MSDSNQVVFPRSLLKKFINLYKELPCLWDKNNIRYKTKATRHEAISKLTKLVQEYDPGATRVHVMRKIESLRACIRREYKRVQDSRQQATDPSEIYTPQLWYYDLLMFVFGEGGSNYKMKDSASSSEQVTESGEDEEDVADHDEQSFEPSMESYQSDYNVSTSMIDMHDNSVAMKRYVFEDEVNKSKRACTEIDDEYDAIGINVAAKLRTLPPNMRIIAEKLINDVLYQAQMNALNSSTVISTPDPFKQDIII